jgi:hypothetical protein
MRRIITTLLAAFLLFGCIDKTHRISEDKFTGLWQIEGRSMLNGVQVKIDKVNNTFVGRVVKLNNNKYVRMFIDSNDIWVTDIKRISNIEFKLTENKIARELFSLYGLTTTQAFRVQFIDDNAIGLATENADPKKSTNVYKRIK